MSETSQPIRPLPSPRLQEIAKIILPKIMDGEMEVPVSLPRPEGCSELWVTVSRSGFLFLNRRLVVSLAGKHPYCKRCSEAIRKMRGQETLAGLADVLQGVISTIQNCNCTDSSRPVAAAAGGDTAQTPLRIQSTANRVKIVSAGEPASPVSETIRLTKPKGVAVVEDGKRAEADEEPVEKYTAPSIRYQPNTGSLVEVTIPRYVCEALVRHCRESNQHPKREIGGVLVGYQGETLDAGSGIKTYTNIITDLIPFKPSDSSGAHLSLDANSWIHVSNIYEEKYQPWKKVRLGWYHTHPTQGIFFSPLDHDFHTNFNQPFQFAIVVNPRSMEAGVIYWKNYENRLTEGPIIFSLKRRKDGGNQDAGASPGASEDESPPLAWLRVLFFTSLMVAVFAYVATQSPPFSVSPWHACLLALSVLLGLRLMNANFFRPRERIENRAWAVLREWGWMTLDRILLVYERHPGLAFIAVLLVIVLLSVLLILQAFSSPQRAGVSTQDEDGFHAGLGGGQSSRQQLQGSGPLQLNLFHSGQTLSLFPNQGMPRVTFRKRNSQWEPEDTEAERIFLRQVLQLDASVNKASDDVRLLQRQLYGAGEGAGDGKADGVWGPRVRNALLGELMQVQQGNREWPLSWSEEGPRFLVVKRAPAAAQ